MVVVDGSCKRFPVIALFVCYPSACFATLLLVMVIRDRRLMKCMCNVMSHPFPVPVPVGLVAFSLRK